MAWCHNGPPLHLEHLKAVFVDIHFVIFIRGVGSFEKLGGGGGQASRGTFRKKKGI